jgi:hypothetical protein
LFPKFHASTTNEQFWKLILKLKSCQWKSCMCCKLCTVTNNLQSSYYWSATITVWFGKVIATIKLNSIVSILAYLWHVISGKFQLNRGETIPRPLATI